MISAHPSRDQLKDMMQASKDFMDLPKLATDFRIRTGIAHSGFVVARGER